MDGLNVYECLTDDTKINNINMPTGQYALHAKNGKLIITDLSDYCKIYGVLTMSLVIPKIDGMSEN